MKVLQLIDTLGIGGAERMCVNIAATLTENEIDSYVVSSRHGGVLKQYLPQSVRYCSLGKKSGFDLAAFRRFFLLVRKVKPTVIHAHSTSLFWAVVLKLFTRNIKVIWHDHYGLSDSLKENDRSAYKFVSRWIDGVIVVNKQLENWCLRNLHVTAVNIVFLKNFPYLCLNTNKEKSKKPILLNLANFRPQKDQLTLVEAVNIVRNTGVEIEVWLAGAYVNIEWLEKVKACISHFNLQDTVKILGPVEDSADVLSKATMGILSSNSEGLPVALLEYGLAGLPVICTDTGQCKEVLNAGLFGIIVPSSDAVALAEAIISMLENPMKTVAMAISFQQHIIKEYGSASFMKEYLPLIQRICK